MKVLVAGGTGTLGKRVVDRLTKKGYQVVSMSRSRPREKLPEGVIHETVDALHGPSVRAVVNDHRPMAIANLLTDLPTAGPAKKSDLASTNRLRIEGTRNLITAARNHAVSRVVSESFLSAYGCGDFGPERLPENAVQEQPPAIVREVSMALRSLEDQTTSFGAGIRTGVALRFGWFNGDTPDRQAMGDLLKRRKMPIIGDGENFIPTIDIEHAADVTVAALTGDPPSGVYNVSNRPIKYGDLMRRWSTELEAPEPRTLPAWLARRVVPFGTAFMTTNLSMDTHLAQTHLGLKP